MPVTGIKKLNMAGSPSRDSVLSTSGFGEERYSRIDEDIAIVTSFQERYRKLRVSGSMNGYSNFPRESKWFICPNHAFGPGISRQK